MKHTSTNSHLSVWLMGRRRLRQQDSGTSLGYSRYQPWHVTQMSRPSPPRSRLRSSDTALPNPACCRGAYLANVTLNASTFRTLSEKLAVGSLHLTCALSVSLPEDGGISTNEFLNQAAHSGMLPRGLTVKPHPDIPQGEQSTMGENCGFCLNADAMFAQSVQKWPALVSPWQRCRDVLV